MLADTLSRAPNSDTAETITVEEAVAQINMVTAALPTTVTVLQQIVKETEMLNSVLLCTQWLVERSLFTDLSSVSGAVFLKWPSAEKGLDCYSSDHAQGHASASTQKTPRRGEMQEKSVRNHQLAWPGINKDIEQIIQKCEICLKHHIQKSRSQCWWLTFLVHPGKR